MAVSDGLQCHPRQRSSTPTGQGITNRPTETLTPQQTNNEQLTQQEEGSKRSGKEAQTSQVRSGQVIFSSSVCCLVDRNCDRRSDESIKFINPCVTTHKEEEEEEDDDDEQVRL